MTVQTAATRTYWYFIIRAMIAAAYITLVATDKELAEALAFPYAALVLLVAVNDLMHVPSSRKKLLLTQGKRGNRWKS